MFVEICEINNIEYLQKLIYTDKKLKTMPQYLHTSILYTKLYLTIQKINTIN